MNTITIYTVTCTKAVMMEEQGTGFSLRPWGANTDNYQGYDDGGVKYVLPEGFHLGTGGDGAEYIYPDGEEMPASIVAHSCGRPQLITVRHGCPVLKKKSPRFRVGQTFETLGDSGYETYDTRAEADAAAERMIVEIAEMIARNMGDPREGNNPRFGRTGIAAEHEAWDAAYDAAGGDDHPLTLDAAKIVARAAVVVEEVE